MFLFYFLYFLFAPTYLYAYLDPGTGSLLLYSLIGIVTTLAFALKGLFYNLRGIFSKKNAKNLDNKKYGIVFHSEGGKYFHVFQPIIEELCKRGIPSVYITPDEKDSAFNIQNDLFKVINPGNEMVTISYMNNLKADIVISTTPHFDIYMWKRSKNVGKYIHFFHAPTGSDFYEKYALSFYDIIFSVGKFTEIGQTALDKKRNLPQKQYYDIGCTYYDYMLKEYNSCTEISDGKTILYAPTWGYERSSFFTSGVKIMETLIASGFNVIFRPHPQFFVSHIKEYNEFLLQSKKWNNAKNLTIDTNKTPIISMKKSDILITDFSGVLFDYAYLSEKQVLLLNVENASGGYEAEEMIPLGVDFDISASKTLAHQLTQVETANIAETVKSYLESKEDNRDKIRKFRDENIFNFGNTGSACADAIISIQKIIESEGETK